ncbi:MAG: extracellular solute-binding protein [Lachnospiraceae bacterium]|nr:extracellular solute-binding protein [Lachnospiraceae bacterium]
MSAFAKRFRIIIYEIIIAISCIGLCACGDSYEKRAANELAHAYNVPEEKQLIVYSSHKEEVYLPIIMEFEDRTGIWVEIHEGGTTEILEKVREASKAGACDIMMGGGVESYEAAKDLFVPYEPSDKDKLDKEYLSKSDLWTPFTELPLVFIYNNKLVSEKEAPTHWRDLLNPKWRGKIAFADLHSSGTSYTILSALSQLPSADSEDLVREFLTGIKGNVLATSVDIIPNVLSGTFPIGITLEGTARKSTFSGGDITMVYPSDGTVAVPDGCAIVKNAPHSYNAGKFIDFLTGYDTQKYATDHFYRRPIRMDVAQPEGYEPIEKIEFDIERSARDEERIFALWDEIIGKEGD